MRRDPPVSRSGGPPELDPEKGSPLPLRATGIVLSVWLIGMVVLALVVVPLIFATCFPQPAGQ